MINIQLPEEDLVKLAKMIKNSDSPFTLDSIISIILNIIFVMTILFIMGVL